MNEEFPHYPDAMLPRLRYQYCPMCTTPLSTGAINDDDILRVLCPTCGWVHFPANAIGVNIVIRAGEDGLVALLPPNAPASAPAALPGGHVEYDESPRDAAIRESREETGLQVEVVRCLGWEFKSNRGYPGPMVSFFFEAKTVGGTLAGSEEGRVRIYPIDEFPPISPDRGGSRAAMHLFKDSMGR